MEFGFDISPLFPRDLTCTVGGKLPHSRLERSECKEKFTIIVDAMGMASARAQSLRVPITTFQKLQSSNQSLYMLTNKSTTSGNGAVVGILKVGRKRLFLSDPSGSQHEVEPLCVLDFYVHESCQRSGCGRKLFESMMQVEGVRPFEVAIDRPSPKFLGFLKKHYNLKSFVKQANNYVVFDQFFSTCIDLGGQTRRLSLQRLSSPHSGLPLSTAARRRSAAFGKLSFQDTTGSVQGDDPQAGACLTPEEGGARSGGQGEGERGGRGGGRVKHGGGGGGGNILLGIKANHFSHPSFAANCQPSAQHFNWSPDYVLKKQSLGDRSCFDGVKQDNFFDGRQDRSLFRHDTVYSSALTARAQTGHHAHALLDSSRVLVGDNKAPYLNVRQQHRRTGHAFGCGRGLPGAVPSSRFHSASHVPGFDTLKYSRHGAGCRGALVPESADLNAGGIAGAVSTTRGADLRQCSTEDSATTGLCNTSLALQGQGQGHRKNRDKWKSHTHS